MPFGQTVQGSYGRKVGSRMTFPIKKFFIISITLSMLTNGYISIAYANDEVEALTISIADTTTAIGKIKLLIEDEELKQKLYFSFKSLNEELNENNYSSCIVNNTNSSCELLDFLKIFSCIIGFE